MKIIKDYCEIIPTFLNENYDSDENDYSPDINFTSEMNDILSLLMNISKSIDKYSGAGVLVLVLVLVIAVKYKRMFLLFFLRMSLLNIVVIY